MRVTPTITLRQHKLRSTPVRRAVLEVLTQRDVAMSAPELEEATGADRITMYRTLKTFEERGILHRIVDGTSVDKFALCGGECSDGDHVHAHPHFHCDDCGDTVCLDAPLQAPPVLPQGYQITDVQLTYRGRCNDCQTSAS